MKGSTRISEMKFPHKEKNFTKRGEGEEGDLMKWVRPDNLMKSLYLLFFPISLLQRASIFPNQRERMLWKKMEL